MCQERFWYLHMGQTVLQYCRQCVECQKAKPDTQKPTDLFQPLPYPDTPWYTVDIDFVMDLPEDKGFSTVMTVVDRFSKICSFIPLRSTIAASVATTFFNKVVTHHGLPRQIISDRDPQFTSEFWRCLMNALKTNLLFSIVFYPQMDSIAEVSNRTLVQLLCIHCGYGKWVKTLPLLALLYNATPQSYTIQSPYFVSIGRQPALLVDHSFKGLESTCSK